MNGTMRTCPTTGLRVHAQADALIKANAVLATLALLVGGVTGLLVLLTRWQAVHLLDVVGLDRERSLSSILDAVVVEQFHLEPPAIREPRLDLPEAAVQLGLGVEALEGDLATDEFVRGCIGHDGVQAAAL